jgi:hypothetical protein
MPRKSKNKSGIAKVAKAILPVAAASQGMPIDPEMHLEIMRHKIIHQLPKSRLKRLLQQY